MNQYFISTTHKTRFEDMILEDSTYPDDLERFALFYIISGNESLYTKRHEVYDWQESAIRPCLEDEAYKFSSASLSLIRLGFNLYNGYSDRYTNPKDLLYNLDETNLQLASNAINIRFNRGIY